MLKIVRHLTLITFPRPGPQRLHSELCPHPVSREFRFSFCGCSDPLTGVDSESNTLIENVRFSVKSSSCGPYRDISRSFWKCGVCTYFSSTRYLRHAIMLLPPIVGVTNPDSHFDDLPSSTTQGDCETTTLVGRVPFSTSVSSREP